MKADIFHILLVEDDKYFRLAIKDTLLKHGVVYEADNACDAIKLIESQSFDIAIVDMHLGDSPLGLKVLEKAQKNGLKTIVLSSTQDDAITEAAYNLGCRHFLAKRHFSKHLEGYLKSLLSDNHEKTFEKFFKEQFITTDKELQGSIRELSNFDLRDKAVFLSGETGVGKTLIGKLIHKLHFDESSPFIHINCSEISQTLMEAELFGYKKGAFTGADRDKKGKLELADGGVLFLDEIATMPKSMQQKLLVALEEKTFYPVGSDRPVSSKFTLISATCEDLSTKIDKGEFREDLFYRICGLNLHIPALKERIGDICALFKYALDRSPRRIVIKESAMEALNNYTWPGNTRELFKVCDFLFMQKEGIINKNDLPENIRNSETQCSKNKTNSDFNEEFILENGLKAYIKLIEKDIVTTLLQKNSGKISKTIKDLKLSSSAFYRIHESLQ